MSWHAEPAEESFWHAHWAERLHAGYHETARQTDLKSDDLGRILLHNLDPKGLHLESGCGAGFWVAALLFNGFQVEGIEYAQELVDLIKNRHPELPIRCEDALNISRPDGHYDSYLSFGVVEHRFEGPEPFLAEAFRVLKPRGRIIISVPFFGSLRAKKARLRLYEHKTPSAPFFQYAFTKSEFVSLLERSGFKIVKSHYLFAHRLLIEEIPLYRWLRRQRGGRFVKMAASRMLSQRDGHMLLLVAEKPALGVRT